VSHQVESGGMTQDKAFQALHTTLTTFCTDSLTPLAQVWKPFPTFGRALPPIFVRIRGRLWLRFGSSFQLSDGLSLRIGTRGKDDEDSLRIGTRGKDDEDNSSNWCELHPPDSDDIQTPSNFSPRQRRREDFAVMGF
jgi:hypothetical protein